MSEAKRITDHAFVPKLDDKLEDRNECCYDGCGLPELAHEWTVGAKVANPPAQES